MGVVRLVKGHRYDQLGTACAQCLGQCADTGLMDDGGGLWEYAGVGQIRIGPDVVRQACGCDRAGQQDRAPSQSHCGSGGLFPEVSRDPDGGRTERKHNRRLTCIKKPVQIINDPGVLCLTIKHRAATDTGVCRPVRLCLCQMRVKQGEIEQGRELSLEQRTLPGGGKTELAPEPV